MAPSASTQHRIGTFKINAQGENQLIGIVTHNKDESSFHLSPDPKYPITIYDMRFLATGISMSGHKDNIGLNVEEAKGGWQAKIETVGNVDPLKYFEMKLAHLMTIAIT